MENKSGNKTPVLAGVECAVIWVCENIVFAQLTDMVTLILAEHLQ